MALIGKTRITGLSLVAARNSLATMVGTQHAITGVVWLYAALGLLVLALGLQRRAVRRRNGNAPINVGNLSDSWLAEQRGQRSGVDPGDT